MKYIANHAALLGLALVAMALAAVLFTGFLDLLARLGTNSFWADASGLVAPSSAAPGPGTQAALAAVQGMLAMIAQGFSAFALAVAVLVTLAAALGLFGLGMLCLRESVLGLARSFFDSMAQSEGAASPSHQALPDGPNAAELVSAISPLIPMAEPKLDV